MRNFLRFLFSAADQARIDASSIRVEDIPYSATPTSNQPYPQALQLSFTVTDPENGPLEIRPLFPGKMTFIVDNSSLGILPAPSEVKFTSALYSTWKTRGMIMIKALLRTYRNIGALSSALEVYPNKVWYSPVQISEDFLFFSLRSGLQKADIPVSGGTSTIRRNHRDWAKHAVSSFLAGHYAPELRLKTSAANDDVIAHPMPTVVMAADGKVSLVISAALSHKPQDGKDEEFDQLAPGMPRTAPAHPRNGAIAARHVYRSLRAHMIDATVGSVIPDNMLVEWPNAPRYFTLRFTRTWKPIENCSFLFPSQTVRVENVAGGLLFEQRLPAHGIVYLFQAPAIPANPPPPNIRVSISGGMRYLDGATPNSWHEKARTTSLAYDFRVVVNAHVIVRRRMNDEMLVERRYTPGGTRCTYLSLRRSVRALIDHRITGGRLNFGPNQTSRVTRRLMDDAWAGTGANSGIVSYNRPRPNASPARARRLEPILEAFFPDEAPAQNIGGSTHRDVVLNKGPMAYNLWQTIESILSAEGSKRNFSNAHVGRGGPGALVAVELARFHVDPTRNPGENDAAYFDRIVGEMLLGLEPGAGLQFWNLSTDYERIKARSGPPTSIGHSPIFLKYIEDSGGNRIGIVVIDQFGETNCLVTGTAGNRILQWASWGPQIWIAANWDE